MFIHSLQTLLLAEILIEPLLNLALIQWYDFKSQTHPYMYGCHHIRVKELYNFVVITTPIGYFNKFLVKAFVSFRGIVPYIRRVNNIVNP